MGEPLCKLCRHAIRLHTGPHGRCVYVVPQDMQGLVSYKVCECHLPSG